MSGPDLKRLQRERRREHRLLAGMGWDEEEDGGRALGSENLAKDEHEHDDEDEDDFFEVGGGRAFDSENAARRRRTSHREI